MIARAQVHRDKIRLMEMSVVETVCSRLVSSLQERQVAAQLLEALDLDPSVLLPAERFPTSEIGVEVHVETPVSSESKATNHESGHKCCGRFQCSIM